MPQTVLLSKIASDVAATALKLKSPTSTATIQFTPSGGGFSGTVCLQFAVTPYIRSGYLWYPIATIGVDPWSKPVTLTFNGQTSVVAFNLLLGAGNLWVRATVTDYARGSISSYIAY